MNRLGNASGLPVYRSSNYPIPKTLMLHGEQNGYSANNCDRLTNSSYLFNSHDTQNIKNRSNYRMDSKEALKNVHSDSNLRLYQTSEKDYTLEGTTT